MAAGTLFVVATPIGNLEDITLRALRVLREVDLIAAEDTRRTAKLLTHYDIHRPVTSLHEHNEWREADRLVAELQGGKHIALVSDAGTPGIADPGSILVDRCLQAGITVSPIPGPSAVMAALSVSGQSASEFVFAGFPPRSGQDRHDWFDDLATERRSVVFFEAPHRIAKTLTDGQNYWSNRQLLVVREISKIHEKLVLKPYNEHHRESLTRGELVVVVGPIKAAPTSAEGRAQTVSLAADLFGCLTSKCEIFDQAAVELAAKAYAISPASLLRSLKKRRIAEKQTRNRLS
jgi:16S rRNA (cytidine1402-2'-O)-methyltransferase